MTDWTPVNPQARASEIHAILAANPSTLLKLNGLSEEDILGRHFGSAVRYFRQAQGLSLQGLAEQLHIEAERIDAIESGESTPTLSVAGELARAFHLRLTQLIVAGEATHPEFS